MPKTRKLGPRATRLHLGAGRVEVRRTDGAEVLVQTSYGRNAPSRTSWATNRDAVLLDDDKPSTAFTVQPGWSLFAIAHRAWQDGPPFDALVEITVS